MGEVAIRAVGLSKLYHLGKHRRGLALRQSWVEALSAPVRFIQSWVNSPGSAETVGESDSNLWALKDVSFEIRRGEVVGIIGRNGAGKSTLLKILSRITDPSEGYVEVRGRVRSLLEVGTGFHPDLTGRENVYLNGAIMGLKKAEIARKFDEIVDFAEVDRFLDTPVKYYSSGMYTRLAFAVAAHLEPDILLVDEVLAVGDAAFQKKSLGKMRHVAREGRTVLFVSHNLQAISVLTDRGLLFSEGRCVSDGPITSVLSHYLQEGVRTDTTYSDAPSPSAPRITRVEMRTSKPGNTQVNDESMEIMFEITTPVSIEGAALSFQVYNTLQQPLLHLWTFDSDRPMCREVGVFRLVCCIPRLHLYMGDYTLTVHFSECAGGKKLQTIEGICPFKVVMYGKPREFEWKPGACAYLEDCDWEVEKSNFI